MTGSSERGREYDDYALHIEHSGTFYTFFDLLTSLDPAILKQLDEATRERFARKQMGPPIHVRMPVKGGQVVGRVGGRSLDISVINTEVTLKGFLSPKLYGHYAWRVHVVDPFDYFDEPLKSQSLKLNARKAELRFGKIDYDIEGRLVGNWFREGSGGYPGDRRDPRGYWMGHLAFAYHHVESTQIIVSIGDFDGRPKQFAVPGNAPDPAKVSAKDGLVKYDLVYAPFNSNGDRIELPPQMRGVQGVLLAQLLEDRKLKIEVLPSKSAADVKAFTSGASLFGRERGAGQGQALRCVGRGRCRRKNKPESPNGARVADRPEVIESRMRAGRAHAYTTGQNMSNSRCQAPPRCGTPLRSPLLQEDRRDSGGHSDAGQGRRAVSRSHRARLGGRAVGGRRRVAANASK